MESLVTQKRPACLTASIGKRAFALCVDTRMSGDVTHKALREKSYA